MSETNRVEGKVAVITGGSRGIGRATALALAERGADIAVLSRTVDASEAVARLVRASGRRAFSGGCDVGSWEDVQRLVQEVSAALGPIDILETAPVVVARTDTCGISTRTFSARP